MQWQKRSSEKFGVLCGAEKSQEWLLPWWWSRYREHNAFPVTFIDFGMTEEMRTWCSERGNLCAIDFDDSCICPRDQIDPILAKQWENFYGWTVWSARHTWFKKPSAFLKSPYKISVWIDIDCEVLGPLKPLFSHLKGNSELALVREYATEHLPRDDSRVRYNSGILVFRHGAPVIEKWAQGAMTQNHLFGGDDLLLSHLIHQHRIDVAELPEIYNWRMARGLNLNAVILHWIGKGGKAYIRKHGGLKPSLDAFYHSSRSLNGLPGSDPDKFFGNLE